MKWKCRYLANARLPTERAHGIQIMHMCAAFATSGLDLELVIPRRYNPLRDDPFAYYGLLPTFRLRRLNTFDLTRWGKILGAPAYYLQNWSFASRAFRDARENPADIYYHRDPWTFKLFAEKGLPSVWEVHDMPERPRRYLRACLNAVKIVAISRGLADDLTAIGVPKEKIVLARGGVTLSKFAEAIPERASTRKRLGWSEREVVILYSGHLYPWKGVDTLVTASHDLPAHVRVVVVGGGEQLPALINKAKAIGARSEFTGHLGYEEIPLYLAAADVFVIPNSAKEEISRRYTSPLKLFEAMAAGNAIIASDLPSLREVLDERTAVFVPPDDAAALRDAIIALSNDAATRRALGRAAREKVQRFDWTSRAQIILNAIRR